MKLGQATVWFNGNLVSQSASVVFQDVVDEAVSDAGIVDEVCSLIASVAPDPFPDTVFALTAHAYLYQDEDAHETCSLTACLNPLHPGPCKGWKGNLFKVAPHAYHALESARVEKANKRRLEKIQALKEAGKPIPKKLLTPIVAKPHPHAGKTANAATGEAHHAGQAVSDAAGVHVQMPGKMTLGQAVKQIVPTDATKELGPKGKKPTVASKGIAAVIAQEKVTPQYKLDKASKITPEQWNALSHDEKAVIRGELAKIQKDGFGPQQKKATELLDQLKNEPPKPDVEATVALPEPTKLGEAAKPKAAEKYVHTVVHNGETITRTSTAHYTHASLVQKGHNGPVVVWGFHKSEANALGTPLTSGQKESGFKVVGALPVTREPLKKSKKAEAPKVEEPKAPEAPKIENEAKKAATSADQVKAIAAVSNAVPGVKNMDPANHDKLAQAFDTLKSKGALEDQLPFKVAVDKIAQAALKVAHDDKTPGLGHGDNDIHIGTLNKEIKDHVLAGKPGLPPMVQKIVDHHDKVEAEKIAPKNVKQGIEEAAKAAHDEKVAEAAKAKLGEKALPPHVQYAVDLANGHAPGSGLSKNHLAAYQQLSDDEFHALPSDVQAKILAELAKGKTKFLDPKKVDAADKLIQKWGAKKSPWVAPKDEIPTAAEATPAMQPKADVPVAQMTAAQIHSRTAELLGDEAIKPNANLTQAELKQALGAGHAAADKEVEGLPDDIKTNPGVSAKLAKLKQDMGQLEASKASKDKMWAHLEAHHMKAAGTGQDVHGNPISPHDMKVITKSGQFIGADHKYLTDAIKQQNEKVAASKKALEQAIEDAKKIQTGSDAATAPKLVSLTDYDKTAIADAYGNAWAKAATSAVTYGLKSYSQKADMKAHPEYAGLTQDLGDLQQAVRRLALAHAELHTAEQNVPVDFDTNAKLPGPEKNVWLDAAIKAVDAQKEYDQLHKSAQAKLDKIRTDVGLKKRALPKIDSPAVKAAAAESGYYKSGGYAGPNYGKPALAKNYMLAKVGPKLAVVHQSASEKKAEKAAKQAEKEAASLPPVAPVKLGGGTGDAAIAHLAPSLKKQITQDFKSMPKGKYLADPAEDVFANLVNLAAAHGKGLDGGLSVEQVLKAIDETHSKNLGVPNSGMLEKKITDWLATPAGKQYAEAHSTPDAKVVKDLLGEIDLPPGIKLEPGEKVQKVAGPGDYDPSIPASAFHAHTASSAQAEQDAYMQAQGIKWSADQKKAIRAYTGNGHGSYSTFNAYLRGEGSASAFHRQQILAIQAAMMPLQSHHLLKRGTGWPPELKQYMSNPEALVGKTIEDPAFVSTSVAGSGGHFSGKPLQLIIEAPKGTAAVLANGVSQYKDSENEMLLAAGTRFRVISVEKTTGGHTVMRVRVVGGM